MHHFPSPLSNCGKSVGEFVCIPSPDSSDRLVYYVKDPGRHGWRHDGNLHGNLLALIFVSFARRRLNNMSTPP